MDLLVTLILALAVGWLLYGGNRTEALERRIAWLERMCDDLNDDREDLERRVEALESKHAEQSRPVQQ